ncbi:very short patch repair endonuclease [Candidatus Bipolaricaulota bacterium]
MLVTYTHRRVGDEDVDNISTDARSKQMSLIRSKDTAPEMLVRKLVHSMGYRYRLHQRDLPGLPDLVFRSRRKIVFVHGCFWHRHSGCPLNRLPKSRIEFWRTKLEGNRIRDRRNESLLRQGGWKLLVIWECETRGATELLQERVKEFLDE